MEKPASMDRSAGDVHVYGNPHITTSPLNIAVVARNIATGLCKVDAEGCDAYKLNLEDFNDRLSRRLYGDRLPEMLGADALDPLARNGRLIPFLEEHGLIEELGGWLGEAMSLRGRKLVCYHKNWIYFTTLFGLTVVDYVEPKPGIPPTARHVAELVQRIEDEKIGVLLTANYFERRKPELIAERTGIVPVVVPMYVRGEPGVETYFDLVDLWIGRLKTAYAESE
jgi:ABC-type Zn uptake system ZnuABC Zn-binding protein ZnuA